MPLAHHAPRLRHLHLPGLTSYHHASKLQSHLVDRLLTYKKNLSSPDRASSQSSHSPPPPATIITFTPPPIYTTGRRELGTLTTAQLATLTKLLPSLSEPTESQTAEVSAALRGGQITFHGPGQLVAYPILSLSHPPSFANPIRPRCYVDLLEQATIDILARYGIKGVRTENPGVWFDGLVRSEEGLKGKAREGEQERKIAAVGVHLRRFVTSHGVAINVNTDLRWFERIVACGLEGKGVTSMKAVGVSPGLLDVSAVAMAWVEEFAKGVNLDKKEVEMIDEETFLNE